MTDDELPEFLKSPWFWVYLAIGLPMAWLHMKREGASRQDVESAKTFRFIILLLAYFWPILLIAMAGSWWAGRADGPRPKK
jgi:hypothetical protein